MRSRKVPQVGWNFEYVMFIFTRVSAWRFFSLAVVNLTVALLMGARYQMDLGTLMRWTIFPNPNHVVDSNIPDVTAGWANGFWQIMQLSIVFFGSTHGVNGLRVVVEDFITSPFWQMVVRGFLFVIWFFMLLVAVYVILGS